MASYTRARRWALHPHRRWPTVIKRGRADGARSDGEVSADAPRSIADLVVRQIYARSYREPRGDLDARATLLQKRRMAVLFHVRRLVRKLHIGRIPIRVVFIAERTTSWWSIDSLYRAC